MARATATAPAKVNLALAVTGRRADGYHTLRSVFLRLALHDDLAVEPAAPDEADSLEVQGESGARPQDDLVLRATASLREHLGVPLPALRFRLTKRIPVAAGLGGGSSDAAAAMDLALAAWGVRMRQDARLAIAQGIGADVPFFVSGHAAALASGIGEELLPLPAPRPPAGILLLTPRERLATAAVFAELDRSEPPGPASTALVDEALAALRSGTDGHGLSVASASLREANDLWAPAARCSVTLTAARAAAEGLLGRSVLLSGSGPTLFAVYPSEADAARAAETVRSHRRPELAGAVVIATSTSGEGSDP
jgi:4-diphosphocytidyl-2-C-methyl-D-erythritol kinase